MKLTVDNWSVKSIEEEIKGFTHIQKVELAIFCAENVLSAFPT